MENIFELIRTLGWLAGALIYGMLVAIFKDGRRDTSTPRAYLFASLSAFLWYAGNLAVDFNTQFAGERLALFTDIATMIATLGVGLLPSTLLHATAITDDAFEPKHNMRIVAGYVPALFLLPACYYIMHLGRIEFYAVFRSHPVYLALSGLWAIVALGIAVRNLIAPRGEAGAKSLGDGSSGADEDGSDVKGGSLATKGRSLATSSIKPSDTAYSGGKSSDRSSSVPMSRRVSDLTSLATKGRSLGTTKIGNKIFRAGLILFGIALFLLVLSDAMSRGGEENLVTLVTRLLTTMLATLPGALILFYVYRFRFMDLKIRRKISFFAGVIAIFLAHALLIRPMTQALSVRYKLDFVLLEGFFVVVVVLAFEPLRRRVDMAVEVAMAAASSRRVKLLTALQAELALLPPDGIRTMAARARGTLEEIYGHPVVVALKTDASGDTTEGPMSAPSGAFDLAGELANWARRADRSYHDRLLPVEALPEEIAMTVRSLKLVHLVIVSDANGVYGAIGLPTQKLGEQDLESLIDVGRSLASLARGAQAVGRLVSLEQKLSEAERLSSLGKLSATIAHEVKNPLSSIKTIANVLKGDLAENPQASKDLEVIVAEVERLARVVENLLAMARPSNRPGSGTGFMLKGGGFDPVEMIQGILTVLQPDARRRGIKFVNSLPASCPSIAASETSIRQAVFQLLLNALELTPSGGEVTLTLEVLELTEDGVVNEVVQIVVEDTGPGLGENKDHIFDEFFTAKKGGTGLGLAIAKDFIERAKGTIRAEDRIDTETGEVIGARFVVELPSSGRVAPVEQ